MQHSIDRILEACNKNIADAENKEAKRHAEALEGHAVAEKINVQKRRDASRQFDRIAETLREGKNITQKQRQWLNALDGFYRNGADEIRLDDLSKDFTKKPELNKFPAGQYVYDLKKVLENLKRDNDGKTTVSTSFLQSAGFNSDIIRWVARI